MITSAFVEHLMNENTGTTDIEHLTDICTLELDQSLPIEQRPAYVLKVMKNPLCFRSGNVGVKLDFDDNAPPLQDVLTNFILRKKTGL